MNASGNYATDLNLRARQNIWGYAPTAPLFTRVLDLVDLSGAERVVDVGCGNGVYLAALRGMGHRGQVLGLDLSPGMATVARDASGLPTAVADAQRLPVATGAADVTLAPHMLYHVPDIPLALRELRRITAPGGIAMIVTNDDNHAAEIGALLSSVTSDLLGRPVTAAWEGHRFRRPTADRLLPAFFPSVTRHDLRAVSEVRSAAAVRAFLESLPTPALDIPPTDRSRVLSEVETRAAALIESHGSFPVTGSPVAYICR